MRLSSFTQRTCNFTIIVNLIILANVCDLNVFKRNVNSFSLYPASCGIHHLMVIWFILVLAWINVFFVNVLEQCVCIDECA